MTQKHNQTLSFNTPTPSSSKDTDTVCTYIVSIYFSDCSDCMAFDSETSENYTDSEKQTQQQVSAFIEQIKICISSWIGCDSNVL